MNFRDAKQWYQSGKLIQAEIMRSPENKNQWFLMLRDKNKKCLMLVDDTEKVLTYDSLDDAVEVIQDIGFRTSVIHV